MTGGPATVMVNRNVKRNETMKIQYYDIKNLMDKPCHNFYEPEDSLNLTVSSEDMPETFINTENEYIFG